MPSGAIGGERIWLSVHEVGDLLGVSPSTVRRWAETGRVPVERTAGGHRRFRRATILTLMGDASSSSLTPPSVPLAVTIVDRSALDGQPWHLKLCAAPVAVRMRGLGQRLLGLLLQHVDSHQTESPFSREARAIGSQYGAEACRAAINLTDATHAFLFFRSACSQWVIPSPPPTVSTESYEWTTLAALHARIDAFMSAVLLGVVSGYEGERSQA
jgi:excisionase family DNA binding protein